MIIHWGSCSACSWCLGATVAVVVLVTVAMLGLSARAARLGPSDAPARPACSPRRDRRGRGLPGGRRGDRAVRALGDRRPVTRRPGWSRSAPPTIPKGSDMTYSLGVDLGTTFVAAAVARPTGVEMFTLGDRTVVTPAVVYPARTAASSPGTPPIGAR